MSCAEPEVFRVATKKTKPNQKMQAWIDARRRHHLSHAQVQMARELGMNPKKLGGLDNHDQEPWKMPLGQFIEDLYRRRLGKEGPELVLSIEEKVSRDAAKKSWDAFRKDPDWQKAFKESRANGPIVTKVVSRFLKATDYSPMQ